ncbi:MAG: PTS sugar transporter subunit IIA [Deltaproteobacteria bacterium]|nr:PTS sugar transporter subunit IIA [Deltaproteobacteria bacterium]
MKITDYLTPELVVAELAETGKEETLKLLAARVAAVFPELSEKGILAVLREREALGSTGIGGGIAIPHGKMAELEKIVVLFARSRQGIDFAAVDGQPVHLFFLLLAPENSAGIHLKTLAQISRMLKNHDFCEQLREAEDGSSLFAMIKQEDERS